MHGHMATMRSSRAAVAAGVDQAAWGVCIQRTKVLAYVQELNSHLAADAAQFNVPVADVLTAFGGTATPNPNTCNYTWMCSVFHDIHATDTGYGVIAGAYASLTGY
jgi:lysophospholipase L1-like esterase